MALTPAIYYLADAYGNGIQWGPYNTGVADFAASYLADPESVMATPCAANGTPVGTFFPMYDGSYPSGTNVGAFVTGGQIAGLTVANSKGYNWLNNSVGIGPDSRICRRLWQNIYTGAPYFHYVKYLAPASLVGGWGSGGTGTRSAFVTERTKINAAAAAVGNTLDTKLVVLDLAGTDIQNWATSGAYASGSSGPTKYEADLIALITWIRANMGGSTKIQLVSHHPGFRSTSVPGASIYVHEIHMKVASTVSDVAVNTSRFKARQGASAFSSTDISGDWTDYRIEDILRLGEDIVDIFGRQLTGSWATARKGIPVYGLIGDSIATGPIPATLAAQLDSASLLGPSGVTRPEGQWVFNGGVPALQTYSPIANGNANGTVNSFSGPEMSLTAELWKLHPDGFVLVKRAVNGSGLCTGAGGLWKKSAGTLYTAFLADVEKANQLCISQLGRVPDFRGLHVILGDNDSSAGGALFAAEVGQFCLDLWNDLSTRTTGKNFPISWRMPQPQTALGLVGDRATIRNALVGQATNNPQFKRVTLDGYERSRDDIHETPETCIAHGRLAAAALASGTLA